MGLFGWTKKNPTAPKPQDVRIAGIYKSADRLGLGKTGGASNDGRRFLVGMESGSDAVYVYSDCERAGTCDWDWHTLKFVRYAKDGDDYPRYV